MLANFPAAVAIYVAHYNFYWMRKSTATAARVARHPWSFDEIYERLMPTDDV